MSSRSAALRTLLRHSTAATGPGHPACHSIQESNGMELLTALAGSLIFVAGSVWWIFRK